MLALQRHITDCTHPRCSVVELVDDFEPPGYLGMCLHKNVNINTPRVSGSDND